MVMGLPLPLTCRNNKNNNCLKSAKYADLDTRYSFQPVAVETLGSIDDSAGEFLFNLGRKISLQSGDDRENSFLFQRISVLIQRFDAILLHDSFAHEEDERVHSSFFA